MDSSSSEQSESDCSSGSPRRLKGKQKDKEYEPTESDSTESDSDESLHNSNSKVRYFQVTLDSPCSQNFFGQFPLFARIGWLWTIVKMNCQRVQMQSSNSEFVQN